MHERQGRIHVFHCDACSEVHEGEEGDNFHDTWAEAKKSGWTAFQTGDQWLHLCVTCKDKY